MTAVVSRLEPPRRVYTDKLEAFEAGPGNRRWMTCGFLEPA
jgi:hypothetical protein